MFCVLHDWSTKSSGRRVESLNALRWRQCSSCQWNRCRRERRKGLSSDQTTKSKDEQRNLYPEISLSEKEGEKHRYRAVWRTSRSGLTKWRCLSFCIVRHLVDWFLVDESPARKEFELLLGVSVEKGMSGLSLLRSLRFEYPILSAGYLAISQCL